MGDALRRLRGVLGTAAVWSATLLGATERERTLSQLTMSRMATWGALGGAAIGLPMAIGMAPVAFLGTSVFVAVLGATSATATVALAKSADAPRQLSPAQLRTGSYLRAQEEASR